MCYGNEYFLKFNSSVKYKHLGCTGVGSDKQDLNKTRELFSFRQQYIFQQLADYTFLYKNVLVSDYSSSEKCIKWIFNLIIHNYIL